MPGALAYAGRRASLATRHDKLALVRPHMQREVGLDVFAVDVDTDALGTFTGEVERSGGQLETAVKKARLGMSESGSRIGIASEGTIGVDDVVPLVSDLELVVIVDDDEGFVLAETARSFDIVSHSWIAEDDQPSPGHLERVGFPDHGLIVMPEGSFEMVFKGIHDLQSLQDAIHQIQADGHALIRVESDLRAHHSPSRRRTIDAAARKLAERLSQTCPACKCPGWGPVDVVRGRRCANCHGTTNGVIATVLGCARCEQRDTDPLADAPADPATCKRCNP